MKSYLLLILWCVHTAIPANVGRLRYIWRVTRLDVSHKYGDFFPTEPAIHLSSQWTVQVNTSMYGTNFITFFATDHNRPLEYACAFSNALCDFSVTKGAHDPATHRTTVSAYLKHPIHLAAPSMTGNLMICTGPVDMFWKRPLFVFPPDPSTNRRYFCEKLIPVAGQNKDILVPPILNYTLIAKRRCVNDSFFSCSKGLLIRPNVNASDKPGLELHIWYMTKENYRDMRLGKLANVIVPLFEKNYTLNLFGSIDLRYNESCSVITPSGKHIEVEVTRVKKHQIRYPINAIDDNAGVYSMSCFTLYNDSIEGSTHEIEINNSLNISFIRGPKIVLDGEKDFIKQFPSNTTSSDILVLVYTTSPLASFQVSRVGKSISNRIFASFVSNSPYEIIWKHNIKISKLDYDMNGVYKINVENEDGETATEQFTLQKAKSLTVLVSPLQITVEVGSQARIECAVIGNLIEKIEWSRDIEDTIKDKNIVVEEVGYGDQESKGSRLTIRSVKMENSGIYECKASNRFQQVTKSLTMIVWPKGGPYLTYNTTKFPPPDSLRSGPTVLGIFEDEIIREYGVLLAKRKKSRQDFAGIMLVLVMYIVVTGLASALVLTWYLCRKKNKRISKSSEETALVDGSSEEVEFEDVKERPRSAKKRKKSTKRKDKRKSRTDTSSDEESEHKKIPKKKRKGRNSE